MVSILLVLLVCALTIPVFCGLLLKEKPGEPDKTERTSS